jgi:hypothetical protein
MSNFGFHTTGEEVLREFGQHITGKTAALENRTLPSAPLTKEQVVITDNSEKTLESATAEALAHDNPLSNPAPRTNSLQSPLRDQRDPIYQSLNRDNILLHPA